MARIRTIKPEFWTDEKVVELSFQARLLFIGLWNFADDEGRMIYSPKRIKMQIFPADSVDVSVLVGEIRGNSMVDTYTVEGIEYLQVSNFHRHQKIDKRSPSKLPAPQNSTESLRLPPTSTDLPPSPHESRRIPTTEGNGMEGKGREYPSFDVFWSSYPKKVAKQDAMKAWLKLKPANGDFDRIMAALDDAKKTEQWKRDDGKFIPHASRWLNGRRFEDETTPPPAPTVAMP